jgi:hypothetical protein
MSKKTFMATIIILTFLVSSLAGIQTVKVAKANPFFGWKIVDIASGTIPPKVTLFSPSNNTVYSESNILLSFNISKPILSSAWKSGITNVEYFLDSREVELYSMDSSPGLQEFNYESNLTLAEGNHTLIVQADGVVLPNNLSVFGMNCSSTILFTVNTSDLSPSSTQQPTIEPSQTPDRPQVGDFAPKIIPASMILLGIVAVGLLVYFSKHKGMKK